MLLCNNESKFHTAFVLVNIQIWIHFYALTFKNWLGHRNTGTPERPIAGTPERSNAETPKRILMVSTLIYRLQNSYIGYKASSKGAGSEARKKCHFSNRSQITSITHEAPLNSKGACPKGFVKGVIPFT